eukprot:428478_1
MPNLTNMRQRNYSANCFLILSAFALFKISYEYSFNSFQLFDVGDLFITKYSNDNAPMMRLIFDNNSIHDKFQSILCTQMDSNNGSLTITNDILHCQQPYTDIISVFGGYCNNLTLFRFYRLLLLQTFLSTTVPKYIFILVHNMANSTMCYGHDKNKELYYAFISFVQSHFKEINIFIEFKPNLMNNGQTRNYLIQMIVNRNIDNNHELAQKFKNIIVSFIDNDDLSHPQKFEMLDLLYSNTFINGTILVKYISKVCRDYNNLSQQLEYKHFFDKLSLYLTNYNINTKTIENIDNFFYNFSVIYQSNYLLNDISFRFYRNLNKIQLSSWSKRKFQKTHTYLLPRPYGQYSNGWPTTTLFNTVTNKYYHGTALTTDEDATFNYDTLNTGFDFYLCPLRLGVYCQGNKYFN